MCTKTKGFPPTLKKTQFKRRTKDDLNFYKDGKEKKKEQNYRIYKNFQVENKRNRIKMSTR